MPELPTKGSRVVLAERPGKGSIKDNTFRQETTDIPSLKDGEVLVRVEYVSIDPAMRGWLDDVRSYLPPVGINETMRAGGIGRVVASKAEGFEEGQLVQGILGWQEYWVGSAKTLQHKETPAGGEDIDHLGLLGTSGMTAYFGIFDVGNLKDGDTVMISGAAGSVGLIVTQIALSHPKCKVIAIAGSDDKCQNLKDLGCHVVLNYKSADFKKKFKEAGLVDVYFDNVGGEILDMALIQLNPHARIVCCGAISGYNSSEPYGLKHTASLISMKAKMQGFIAFDYTSRYPEGAAYLASLKEKGKIQYKYHILDGGLADCTKALQGVFSGANYGKTLVKISTDSQKSRM